MTDHEMMQVIHQALESRRDAKHPEPFWLRLDNPHTSTSLIFEIDTEATITIRHLSSSVTLASVVLQGVTTIETTEKYCLVIKNDGGLTLRITSDGSVNITDF